jgi:hypothetical protein
MEFYRGLVRAYDAANHKAAVLLAGSMSRVLLNVPVAHQIGPELMAEGTACGVLFFAEGASGVVVCTFDGPPGEWVTTDLVVEGSIDPDDLNFSPCTPDGWSDGTSSDQTLTTTGASYDTLSKTISVPSGKTYRVLAMANVEFECTSYTNWNIDLLGIYKGSNLVGQPQGYRTNAVNDRASVTVAVQTTIAVETAFATMVWKSQSRNTEVAHRGHMVVLWWEDT